MTAFLCAVVLALNATAGTSSMPAEDLIRNAQAALADELYELAERHSSQLIARADLTESDRFKATMLLARALHGMKNYNAMRALLVPWIDQTEDMPRNDAFNFWLATAEFELGEWENSLKLTDDFESRWPDSEYLPFAVRLRAWSYLKLGRLPQAITTFAEFADLYSDLPEDAANRLDWGRALVESGENAKAREVLVSLIKIHPDGRAAQEARIILSQLLLDDGQAESARKVVQPLLDQKNVPGEILGMGFLALASVAEAQTNQVEALELLERGLNRITDPQLKGKANLRKGTLLLQAGKIGEGTTLIRGFVTDAPHETAARVQLELGRTLQKMDLHEKALVEFQNYIETFTDPAGVSRAWQERGWSLVQLNRHMEAAAAYERSAELADDPMRAATLWRKSADCLFKAHQFRQAELAYRRTTETVPGTAMAEQALFQAALCMMRQELYEEAGETLWTLIDQGPDDDLATRAFLQMAEIMQQQENPDAARMIYRLILSQYAPEHHAGALYHAGLMEYRLGLFQPALEYFNRVTADFPENELAHKAAYMQGWCHYMLQNDDAAIKHFEQFIVRYPDSDQAPAALFWLAEYNYNRGHYYLAETRFLQLAGEYPVSNLAPDAIFWAGRAALMQNEFRRANEHFTRLIRAYPETHKRPEARFYQGEALCELGEFAGAILIFDEIIKQFPDSYLAERAWFRKGDSQYTLGSDDPQRYEEAITSYRMIINRADVAPAARMHAEYKIARCLEKTGRRNEAFEYYMNVVYEFFNHPAGRARNAIWFTRAAFNAAAMKEEEKAWRKAVAIYQRVVDANVTASPDAAERIQRIRLDQWMFFY